MKKRYIVAAVVVLVVVLGGGSSLASGRGQQVPLLHLDTSQSPSVWGFWDTPDPASGDLPPLDTPTRYIAPGSRRRYSARSASTGSSRAARHAG